MWLEKKKTRALFFFSQGAKVTAKNERLETNWGDTKREGKEEVLSTRQGEGEGRGKEIGSFGGNAGGGSCGRASWYLSGVVPVPVWALGLASRYLRRAWESVRRRGTSSAHAHRGACSGRTEGRSPRKCPL